MTDSEKKALILSCRTYEEYDNIRCRVKHLVMDNETKAHIDALIKLDKYYVRPEYFILDDSNHNEFFNDDETT